MARAASRVLLSPAERRRLEGLHFRDAGHGYDAFGMLPESVVCARGVLDLLHRYYFRVRSHGAENLPRQGGAILIANHAGTLPFDAAMICVDVSIHTDPPRVARVVTDFFVPRMPFVGTLFSRVGAVNGARGNVSSLLRDDELLLIFPEGLPAIGKPFRERYRLRELRAGHAELALELGVPIIPVAVIGSEEQWPQLGRAPGIGALSIPYLPMVATPLPLPVRYHIHYGQAIDLCAELGAGPPTRDVLRQAIRRTTDALQALVDHGLAQREGLFR